jgi:hypothetical protein
MVIMLSDAGFRRPVGLGLACIATELAAFSTTTFPAPTDLMHGQKKSPGIKYSSPSPAVPQTWRVTVQLYAVNV